MLVRDPLRLPTASRRSGVVDAVLAVACVAVTLLSAEGGAGGLFGGLLVAAALACRTRLPTAAALLVVVSYGLQIGVDGIAVLAWIGYAPLIYYFAAYPRALVRFGSGVWWLLVAVGAGWSITGVVGPDTALGQRDDAAILAACVALFLAPVAVVWAFGYVGFQRRAAIVSEFTARQVDEERRRAVERLGVEEERNEIARDIHDVVAHSLTVVVAQAEGARYQLDNSPDAARRALEVIAQTGRSSLTDVRVFLEQLRHRNIPTDAGTYRESRDFLLDQFRAAGMVIDTSVEGEPGEIPGLVSVTLYRVVAEALTNALKHGDLSRSVYLGEAWEHAEVRLTVRNTIPVAGRDAPGTSMGLTNIVERVSLARGSVTAGPVGGEWVLTARFPIATAADSSGRSSEGGGE